MLVGTGIMTIGKTLSMTFFHFLADKGKSQTRKRALRTHGGHENQSMNPAPLEASLSVGYHLRGSLYQLKRKWPYTSGQSCRSYDVWFLYYSSRDCYQHVNTGNPLRRSNLSQTRINSNQSAGWDTEHKLWRSSWYHSLKDLEAMLG